MKSYGISNLCLNTNNRTNDQNMAHSQTNQTVGSNSVDALIEKHSEDGMVTISADQLRSIMASTEISTKPSRRKNRVRDPNRPKKGKSAYLFYTHSEATKKAFQDAHPEKWDDEKNRPNKMTDLTKFASEQWKILDDEAKAPYISDAEHAKAAYKLAMEEYRPTVSASSRGGEVPDAPEGWSGPLKGYYLYQNADGRKTYKIFADAVEAANSNPVCMGITQTSSGSFSLRKMEGGSPIQSPDGRNWEVSWVKGDVEVTKIVVSTTSPKSKANGKTKATTSDVEMGVGKDTDVEIGDADVKVERSDVSEEDFDPDAESDDEEEAEVSRWIFEGKEYLVDESSGEVYDADEYENNQNIVVIGTRSPNTSNGKLVVV